MKVIVTLCLAITALADIAIRDAYYRGYQDSLTTRDFDQDIIARDLFYYDDLNDHDHNDDHDDHDDHYDYDYDHEIFARDDDEDENRLEARAGRLPKFPKLPKHEWDGEAVYNFIIANADTVYQFAKTMIDYCTGPKQQRPGPASRVARPPNPLHSLGSNHHPSNSYRKTSIHPYGLPHRPLPDIPGLHKGTSPPDRPSVLNKVHSGGKNPFSGTSSSNRPPVLDNVYSGGQKPFSSSSSSLNRPSSQSSYRPSSLSYYQPSPGDSRPSSSWSGTSGLSSNYGSSSGRH